MSTNNSSHKSHYHHHHNHQKMYPNFSLKNKVYVVTGGARGLGLCMAEAMTEAGAEVHCLDILEEPAPEFIETQELAARSHVGSLYYHHVDVRETKFLNDTIVKIAGRHHRMDGLVAAAGVQQIMPAIDCTAEDITRIMDVNYIGAFMTAQAVARQMIAYKTHGSIVLIASMSGLIANRGLISPAYNASKAALIQLARSLAMEWGQEGIRVNSLSPGHIVTPMVEKNLEEVPGLDKIWEHENMLGRLACPEEFTGAAIFMLSEASSFMTGSNIVIDGGHTAW
ncbi:alcohol dehydrogenase [[Emmonsia] crescens]|uniref:Alcohol dehydrogenase n=1 Tax=[Emmonsia] crescens TaxID=73230 RepID=A0A0G2JCA1_9EURO|nr:alcohol dehydrogenase [Emmonsia crescens UAMH 3008]